MALSSSTSNSDQLQLTLETSTSWTKRIAAIAVASWCVYGIVWCASSGIHEAWGDTITQVMRLRTYNGGDFVLHRTFDVAYLTSLICVLAVVFLWLCFYFQSRLNRVARVILLTAIGFLLTNVFTFAAMRTTMFWLTLLVIGRDYQLHSTEAEWRMLQESKASVKGVIMGSSQACAQIDAKCLNRDLGPNTQFANLSYIGSQSFTILMLQDYLQAYPDVVVCYLSSYNFYREIDEGHLLSLWNSQTSKELKNIDASSLLSERGQLFGKISSWLPIFRCRRMFELALFGKTAPLEVSGTRVTPRERQIQGEQDFKHSLRIDRDDTKFQEAALEQLIQNCEKHGTKVVLISGTISQTEFTTLDPSLNQNMRNYLARLQSKYDHLTVLTEGKELPRGTPDQYRDILHLSDEHQPWYSRALAECLADELQLEIRPDASPEACSRNH